MFGREYALRLHPSTGRILGDLSKFTGGGGVGPEHQLLRRLPRLSHSANNGAQRVRLKTPFTLQNALFPCEIWPIEIVENRTNGEEVHRPT
jgi:hypothetical protein